MAWMGALVLCFAAELQAAPGISCAWTFSHLHAVDEALEEMSGLVISRQFADRFYHVNDSGHAAEILVTDAKGHLQRRFPFAKGTVDTEDLSLGPCADMSRSCLYVADTGDNFRLRSRVRIHRFPEDALDQALTSAETLDVTYPDGSVDVEAQAVHPTTGDVFLFTKKDRQSQVFRIPQLAWTRKTPAIAEVVASLPHGPISGAAFSPDGQRLLLISWRGVLQFSAHTAPGFKSDPHMPGFPWLQSIKVPPLPQIEAIAFHPDGRSFTYTSEKKFLSNLPWGMVTATCRLQSSSPTTR
jgi:hypothetical protein